jgi:hypothetical protein
VEYALLLAVAAGLVCCGVKFLPATWGGGFTSAFADHLNQPAPGPAPIPQGTPPPAPSPDCAPTPTPTATPTPTPTVSPAKVCPSSA